MAERFQYPIQAALDPEALSVAQRDEIQWFQSLSEPIRQLGAVVATAALIASSGVAPIDPTTLDEAPNDEIQWFQPLSEPMQRVAEAVEGGRFFVDEIEVSTDTSFEWFVALSEPVLPLPWHQPEYWFADPTTLDAGLRDELQWWRDLDIPVLPRDDLAALPSFFIDPEALGEVGTGLWTKQTPGSTSWSDVSAGSTIWTDDTPGSTGWTDA